jgi:hypothetical protein
MVGLLESPHGLFAASKDLTLIDMGRDSIA